MADDEFDIDIYGDSAEQDRAFVKDDEGDVKIDGLEDINGDIDHVNLKEDDDEQYDDYVDVKIQDHSHDSTRHGQHQIKSTDESSNDLLTIPKQAPRQQGVKRKEGSDDRPIDPGATTAILISDLHWWNTDDDIRGWVNQAQCEDELKEVTISEHKINGKSKGQAYVEFTSQQAATAAKHKIDAFGEGLQYVKKHTATYSNPNVNPFKTLPKDAPLRDSKASQNNHSNVGAYSNRNGQTNNFRGRGSSYGTNRGNMNNSSGGGFNRNFSGQQMGGMASGFQPVMGGFQSGQMGGQMNSQFGGFNRGGMMNGMRGGSGGMRVGRGGMGNVMMGGMPMGGMPMVNIGRIAPPMGMGQMGGGMPGGGFQGLQPHFNPAFFPPNHATGGDWQNPHGAKRPRPE